MRSFGRDELRLSDAETAAWDEASSCIARKADKPPGDAADEALMLSYPGQTPQSWHQESAAGVGYVLALKDETPATELLQLDTPWVDTMAVGAKRRRELLDAAWAAATPEAKAVSGGKLEAGDVVFFYTHAIHRSPPPGRTMRYTLFGTYGAAGRSEGEAIFRDTQEAIWARKNKHTPSLN